MGILSLNRYQRAVTLIEVMVGSMVMLIAILALIGVFGTSLITRNLAHEITIATDDLKDVLEYIKCVPFPDITNTTAGGFDDGDSVDLTLIGYSASDEGFLEEEDITVSYPNGTAADPLEIEVRVDWRGRDSRNYNQSLITMRTGEL
jgi:hypothetical protein